MCLNKLVSQRNIKIKGMIKSSKIKEKITVKTLFLGDTNNFVSLINELKLDIKSQIEMNLQSFKSHLVG